MKRATERVYQSDKMCFLSVSLLREDLAKLVGILQHVALGVENAVLTLTSKVESGEVSKRVGPTHVRLRTPWQLTKSATHREPFDAFTTPDLF